MLLLNCRDGARSGQGLVLEVLSLPVAGPAGGCGALLPSALVVV